MWVTLKLPETGAEPLGKPRCPYCKSPSTKIYERMSKRVKDPNLSLVGVVRRKCERCGRTFRHYAPGVGRSIQTSTLKALNALLYSLGLSYSQIASLLEDFGVSLVKSTVWRSVRLVGRKACYLHSQNLNGQVRIRGITSNQLTKEAVRQTRLVRDLLAGKPLDIEFPDTKKGKTLADALTAVAEKTGLEFMTRKEKSSAKGYTTPSGLQKDPYMSRLRNTTRKRCRQLSQEAEQLLKRAKPAEKARLQGLIDDCRAIIDIIEGRKEVSEKEFWEIYKDYTQAKAPGKGGTATIWYKMRLLTLRLWDQSNRIVKHLGRYYEKNVENPYRRR